MSDKPQKPRGLGRGLGALIPTGEGASIGGLAERRPRDLYFRDLPVGQGSDQPQREERRVFGVRPAHPPYAGSAPAVPAAGPETPPVEPHDRLVVHAPDPDVVLAPEADLAPDVETHAPHGLADTPRAVADGADSGGEEDPRHVDDGAPAVDLAPVPGASFAELGIDDIVPNARQPRTVFDEDDLGELAHSIATIGMLQPIVVRRRADAPPADAPRADGDEPRFELVMGERRWRAAQQAGLATVPAIIRTTGDDAMLRDALLENLHRSQLNPLEEGAAYQQLLEDFGCTHEELATRIGRSRPQISNTIRLLKLPPLVARRVAAGVLSAGHARALLTLNDNAEIERLAQRIVAEGLSVRAVEEIAALGRDAKPKRPRRTTTMAQMSEEYEDFAAQLSDKLDTRVRIAVGRTKGRLTVEFAGREDLDRILAALAERRADTA